MGYIASNRLVVRELKRMWKEAIYKYTAIWLRIMKKAHEKLSHDIRSSSLVLDPEPSEYKRGLLRARQYFPSSKHRALQSAALLSSYRMSR
jgi:hypothetical protein